MVSIVDPAHSLSGASTVTRGLLRVFEAPDLRATVECLATRPPSNHYHSLRQIGSIARSFVYAMPAKAAFTFSRNFRDRVLERANREHFDLVIINGSDLLWLDTVLPSTIPRLLIAHNIEHLLFAAQAETLERSFPLFRPVLRWERRRMERFETAGIRSVGNAIFLSSFDASHPQAGALASRTLVTPPLFCRSSGQQGEAQNGDRRDRICRQHGLVAQPSGTVVVSFERISPRWPQRSPQSLRRGDRALRPWSGPGDPTWSRGQSRRGMVAVRPHDLPNACWRRR